MSLFDLFKTDNQRASEAQIPQPAPSNNPTPTQVPAASATTTPPENPFADLWKNDDNSNDSQTGLNFDLDPNKLSEIAGKMDYSQAISPEIRQRIAAGGEDAMAATMEALNVVNRLSYQQNAMATTKLIEAAVKNTESSLEAKIAKQFKLMGLEERTTNNPALKDPAFSPMVEAAKKQLVVKYPNATPAELTEKLNNYLSEAAKAFDPDLVKRANTPRVGFTNQPQSDDMDWEAYFQL